MPAFSYRIDRLAYLIKSGSFASDTIVITANQTRMALAIAAACDAPVGFGEQRGQVASIMGSAFGLRAIAQGFALTGISDEERLAREFPMYDALYEYVRQQLKELSQP